MALEQEVEELWRKFEESKQHRQDVEEKLSEWAVMAIGHVVGILKSHVPNLNLRLISQGYSCEEDEAKQMLEENQPTIELFVDKLDLSVGDEWTISIFSWSYKGVVNISASLVEQC